MVRYWPILSTVAVIVKFDYLLKCCYIIHCKTGRLTKEGGKKMSAASEGDVFSVVKAIIVEQLGVDEDKVKPEANFREDLEADSLDLVELIMAFEEYFEEKFGRTVEISDEEAQEITTVGQAVGYIEKRMAEEGLA
jgi:acyl carrier protein